MTIRMLVRNEWELQDAADELGVGVEDAARDLALLAVIASLADRFGSRVVFKGGAVLRFGHGAARTSRDADATVTDPARSPLSAEDVADALQSARLGQFLRVRVPALPATDNRYSLDFDRVGFDCAGVAGTLDVELSFREDLVLAPQSLVVGAPYFEPFTILALQPVEMAGEKLRALAQRERGTDLGDCVLLEQLAREDLGRLEMVRIEKFKLVRSGVGADSLRDRIDRMRRVYETDVRRLEPNAPDYETARSAALTLVRHAWR